MTGPRAVPVRMTVKRERKLRQVIAAGTSPQRLALRARIILAAADSDPNAKIARDLGCSVNTVREWRARFARLGIPGIFDRPRPGRREAHGPSVRLLIIATATSAPPGGESRWSQESIARQLRERGLEVSRATVGRALAEARVRPHKVRGWLNRKDDPAFWAQARSAASTWTRRPAPSWSASTRRPGSRRSPGDTRTSPPGPAGTPAANGSTAGTAPSRSSPR